MRGKGVIYIILNFILTFLKQVNNNENVIPSHERMSKLILQLPSSQLFIYRYYMHTDIWSNMKS